MRVQRPEQPPQIKTLNSQKSDIDLFSKLEVGFLEKFFRYNLTDYCPDILSNVYEDVLERKATVKAEKSLATSIFLSNNGFIIEEFQKRVDKFYRARSKSISQEELPYAFKLKYCNKIPAPNLIKPKELIFIDVKIKAEVQKIVEFPQKILNTLKVFKNKKGKLSQLQKLLSNYKEEYFTIFIVYFGDSNFNIFNKEKYQTENIQLFGNTFKVRIFVFYVSKQALIETFRSVNKIQNLEYINDLVIQFYELRREKQRRKRHRENNQIQKGQDEDHRMLIYKIMGLCGLVTLGFVIKKLLI